MKLCLLCLFLLACGGDDSSTFGQVHGPTPMVSQQTANYNSVNDAGLEE